MRTIWKFPVRVTDKQEVMMPAGAEILSIQMQNGEPCLWALVEPEQPKEPRTIITHGTGHTVTPGKLNFIGTYQMHGGGLVFHAFELMK